MNKPNCEQCRYYLSIDETKGFCGNIRVNKPTRAAAHVCGQYEPYCEPPRKGGGNDTPDKLNGKT